MKKILAVLFVYFGFIGQNYGQYLEVGIQEAQKRKREDSFMFFMGFDIGRVYGLPYKQQSNFDWWLLERDYPSLSQANNWNLGLNMNFGFYKFMCGFDMALVTPFYYEISPIRLNFGLNLAYEIARSEKSCLYLGGGLYYQYLDIDFKGNVPFELQIVPVPHDQSSLMQHYLMLTTQLNFYQNVAEVFNLGFRLGVNWNVLASDWKYGYYVTTGSTRNRSYTSFRGASVNVLPSANNSALYATFTFGFGIIE